MRAAGPDSRSLGLGLACDLQATPFQITLHHSGHANNNMISAKRERPEKTDYEHGASPQIQCNRERVCSAQPKLILILILFLFLPLSIATTTAPPPPPPPRRRRRQNPEIHPRPNVNGTFYKQKLAAENQAPIFRWRRRTWWRPANPPKSWNLPVNASFSSSHA